MISANRRLSSMWRVVYMAPGFARELLQKKHVSVFGYIFVQHHTIPYHHLYYTVVYVKSCLSVRTRRRPLVHFHTPFRERRQQRDWTCRSRSKTNRQALFRPKSNADPDQKQTDGLFLAFLSAAHKPHAQDRTTRTQQMSNPMTMALAALPAATARE